MSLQSYVRKICRQNLVYWEASIPGGFGTTTYKKPVEIKCRWEDVQEELVGADGRTRVSNAHVILLGVQPVLASILFQGTLADWKKLPTYPKIPTSTQGGFEVIKSGHTPDKKGRDLLFEAYL